MFLVDKEVQKAYEFLEDIMGVSSETMQVVTALEGLSMETMERILWATTGYRSFNQLDEWEDDEWE